jgi:segregation and condensation protein B
MEDTGNSIEGEVTGADVSAVEETASQTSAAAPVEPAAGVEPDGSAQIAGQAVETPAATDETTDETTAEPPGAAPAEARTQVAAAEPAEPAEGEAEEEPAMVGPEVLAIVEAVLFSTDSPLSPAKVAQVAELPNRRVVKKAVAMLNERYEQVGCTFRIESIAGGYQMMSLPEYHDVVSRLFKARSDSRLSQAAMETLAVVAYRQPVLRADIEAIRGVASGEVLRGLMEKQLVKIVGRAEVLGRPMLYGTTKRFLEIFGLSDLKDLPKVEELRGGAKGMKDEQPKPAGAEGAAPAEVEDAETRRRGDAGINAPAPAEAQVPSPIPAEPEAPAPAEEPPGP